MRKRSFAQAVHWLYAAATLVALCVVLAAPAIAAQKDDLESLPGGLAYAPQARPWGDTYLPKSPPPARRLLLVDATKCTPEERLALACLQGLTSRKEPRIWLLVPGQGKFWLDRHVEKKYIDGYDSVADWRGLFRQFADAFRGAVVPDRNLYRGDVLAANVAACEDLIIASPELAAALGLPVKVDLRGRFTTYADGMQWVWNTYKGRLNHHLASYLYPRKMGVTAFAYELEWRAVMFWIAGTKDAAEPGADPAREERLMAGILAEMAPNTAVLGFPFGGEGIGIGEPRGVALISRYAKALVCPDFLANACVTSGVRIEPLRQAKQAPPPPLARDKIYIALAVSDGDNQNTWLNFMKPYFEHPRHGEFPVAHGMGPPILDLMPAVAEWYYERGGPNTEFLADVSGIGYIQPKHYATAFTERDAAFDGFLDWTQKYLARMDMATVRTVGGEDDLLARYARKLPGLHSLFADMGRYSGRSGIANLTYALPDGMPVFRSATSWRYGKDGFLREVREQVGAARPAFANGFVHCWTFHNMDDIARIYDGRDKDMVFVTPSQLAALYRKAKETKGVK